MLSVRLNIVTVLVRGIRDYCNGHTYYCSQEKVIDYLDQFCNYNQQMYYNTLGAAIIGTYNVQLCS